MQFLPVPDTIITFRVDAMIDETLLEAAVVGREFLGLRGNIRFSFSLGSFPRARLT